MMQYADRDTKKRRLWAALATLFYALLWVLLVVFVTFRIHVPDDSGEGILVDFGSTETGFGDEDLAANDEAADAALAQQTASEADPAEQLTQQVEEAPAVVPTPPTPRPATTRPTPPNPTPAEEQPVEQPRQVDRRALFPGRTQGSASTSEGTAAGAGNQGNPAGDPAGAHEGTGTGNSGISYSLDGRSSVGALPKPDYPVRQEGRVIIDIWVDQQGTVTRVAFRSRGSTTTNAALVAAAERAALAARFNVSEEAAVTQTGSITYNFRME
jgi:TonB family protein